MANIKSNIKRARQNKKRYILHKGQRSDLNKTIKAFKNGKNNVTLSDVYSKSDKLAKKHVISKNKARRIKSRAASRAYYSTHSEQHAKNI